MVDKNIPESLKKKVVIQDRKDRKEQLDDLLADYGISSQKMINRIKTVEDMKAFEEDMVNEITKRQRFDNQYAIDNGDSSKDDVKTTRPLAIRGKVI